MESFFAHNDLNIDFDDITSLEGYYNAFQRLNEFEQDHINLIQSLENQILEKRKILSQRCSNLANVQEKIEKIDKMQREDDVKRIAEKLETNFTESLYSYLIDHSNLSCDSNQKLERVMIPFPHELGQEFVAYVDPIYNTIQKVCVISDDQSKTERELKKEEILAMFFDITDAINRDIKRDDIPQNNPDRLKGIELSNLLLELKRQNKI